MEYKFRGKRLDNGEWVYGFYLETQMSGVFILGSEIETKKRKDGITMRDKLWQHEVLPESVGQWTGLVDRHGVEIYENDILRCVSRLDMAHMIVLFEEGEFRMVLCADYDSYTTGRGFYALRCFEKEVIGNIHNNPELMEVNNESY